MTQKPADILRSATGERLVEMGVFSVPHGVRGHIKLRSYATKPEQIARYSPLLDAKGTPYTLKITGQAGDMLIAQVEGITDRNAAERLKNITLYVPRSTLPKLKKGEYYMEDLRGLCLTLKDGTAFGHILSAHNFGAGTLANVALANGGEEYFAFNPTIFPEINLETGTAVIDPPLVVKGEEPHE